MTITSFTINFTGRNNVTPRIGHLYAPNDTLTKIKSIGYLDDYILSQNFPLYTTDIIAVAASDGNQFLKPTFGVNRRCTLKALP